MVARISWITVGALLLGLSAPAPAGAEEQVNFQAQVWPILKLRCIKCHKGGKKKPKGDLRLDGKGWILLGGEEGSVLNAGDPEGSSIYKRISLPADHEDIMPAKGEPLSAAQVETVRTWIAQGASFESWQGTAGGLKSPDAEEAPRPSNDPMPQATMPARFQVWQALGEGVLPASSQSLEAAREAGAQVIPVFPGSPLLRVQFISTETQVDDVRLSCLEALAGHISELNLGKTVISDAGLERLQGMPRLTHLDLRQTKVGDTGLASLAGHKELRWVNLFESLVSDASLDVLAGWGKLQAVYLWGSQVSEEGAATLRQRLPQAKVQRALDLPPAPEGAAVDRDGKKKKKKKKK